MNIGPPPESDSIADFKNWANQLYRFLQYAALQQLKLIGRSDAPEDATAGVIYYDSDDNKLKCHNGTGWQDLF